MKRDGLSERLRGIPVPPSGEAREVAVAEARAEVEGRADATPSRRELPRRHVTVLAAAALLAAVLITPPGRAASAWVGDLVGLGEVGGPPTMQEGRSFADDRTAVVIENGTAPDGTRYEWVAYECSVDLREEGSGTKFEGIGMSLEWPGVKGHEGTGHCEELQGRPRPEPDALGSHGVHILPSQFKGVENPDLVISGTAGPGVHRVEVLYQEPDGDTRELPVDFARVDGELLELAHRPEALGTFVAFLPGEIAARDEVETRLDLRALYGTGKLELGPIARRERELAAVARERCREFEVDPAELGANASRAEVDRALKPMRDCLEEHMPPSPFIYVAYDERGRELARFHEPLITAGIVRPQDIEPAGHEGPNAERNPFPWGKDESVEIVSGRAPDGALYEVRVTRHRADGFAEVCTMLWWPYVAQDMAGVSCGGFPPETAFGRRDPESVAARPYGFLNDAPHATRHRVLSGFARPWVSRVRVVYEGRDGERHDAPLKLVRVSAEELARVGADGPIGYWVAFVPRGTGAQPTVEVIAYDEDGNEAGRIDYRA